MPCENGNREAKNGNAKMNVFSIPPECEHRWARAQKATYSLDHGLYIWPSTKDISKIRMTNLQQIEVIIPPKHVLRTLLTNRIDLLVSD